MDQSEIFQQALALINSGEKLRAREILQEVIQREPYDARLWALLSMAVDDPDKKRECYSQIQLLSRHDEKIMAWANQQLTALPPANLPEPLSEGIQQPFSSVEPEADKPPESELSLDDPKVMRLLVLVAANILLLGAVIFGIVAFTRGASLSPRPTLSAPTPAPSQTSLPTLTPTPEMTVTPSETPRARATLFPLMSAITIPADWDVTVATTNRAFGQPNIYTQDLKYSVTVDLLRSLVVANRETGAQVNVLLYSNEVSAANDFTDLVVRAAQLTGAHKDSGMKVNGGEYALYSTIFSVEQGALRYDEAHTSYVFHKCNIVYTYDLIEFSDPGNSATAIFPMSVKRKMFTETERGLAKHWQCAPSSNILIEMILPAFG